MVGLDGELGAKIDMELCQLEAELPDGFSGPYDLVVYEMYFDARRKVTIESAETRLMDIGNEFISLNASRAAYVFGKLHRAACKAATRASRIA